MLSSRAYGVFRDVILKLEITTRDANFVQELWDISHPYVICIHRPTRRAFLLNRRYLHITDVSFCAPPEEFVEHTANYRRASFELPDWVDNCNLRDFDSYWLY